jgi:hypothetical protein
MTLAEKTKALIENRCPDCFSLYAGYGLDNGRYVRFPGGVLLSETRNDKGRCMSARYQYADSSTLKYQFSPGRGTYTLKAN